MKNHTLLILIFVCTISQLSFGQQTQYNVTAGNGNGLRFWSSDNYKIHMGNTSEYKFGPVTDYSIKMNMSTNTGRGWTWGVGGKTPVAALSNLGDFKIAGNITTTGYVSTHNPNNASASVSLSWLNDIARIRVGGINAGASNGFHIQGPGERSPLRILGNGNTGIGTTTPDAKLAVNGKIHAKEVKVDLNGWADYVFKDDYDLPSLQQVENHIAQKGHLINIPSAEEVAKNGIQLGEMNAKLLEKIEELTLYTIAQEKEVKTLRLENQNQKTITNQLLTNNQKLEARLAKLEEVLLKK